jgi:peptide/nickel transport system permease protein
MTKYVIRRLLSAIPLLAIICVIVFFGLRLSGADPLSYMAADPRISEADRQLIRTRLGLNDSLPMQFVHWLIGDDWQQRQVGDKLELGTHKGVLRGDFGDSIRYRRPVLEIIGQFLPNTLLLGLTAYVVTVILSLAIGIFAALRQYTVADNVITGASFVTYSMPIFFIALLSVQLFAVQFKAWHDAGASWLPYLPVQGMYDVRGDRNFAELLRHMILPVFSLTAISVAGYSRYIRATMLEVIHSDYIRTARSKGLSERRIVYLHALKNASLPIVTLIGIDLPFVLAGAVVTETIFGWPGMGRLFITSLDPVDPPVIMVFVLMIAVAVVLAQIFVDVLYAWLDPRIRYS